MITGQFNYSLARLAAEYAAASYADDPTPCLRRHNSSLVLQLQLPCDAARNKCWAIIADAPSMIIVAFQGTNSREQLLTELLETITSPKHDIKEVGSVQRYFFVALKSIANPLATILNDLRAKYPEKPILFTGHSLGGALASLAATLYSIKYSLPAERVHLITFGQPRVGNHEYAQTVDRVIPMAWRLIHKYDLVAHIPFCAGITSCDNFFNHSPYHHGTEIWFPGNMSRYDDYRVCRGLPLDEDSSCSNQHYFRFNIFDHLFYFDMELSRYGHAGCNGSWGTADAPPRTRQEFLADAKVQKLVVQRATQWHKENNLTF